MDEPGGVMIAVITFRLRAEWARSLKDKRMTVNSLLARMREKFRVSAAETGSQDAHQIIVITAAAVVPNRAVADSVMDSLSRFTEDNTDAEILEEIREIR